MPGVGGAGAGLWAGLGWCWGGAVGGASTLTATFLLKLLLIKNIMLGVISVLEPR